MRYFITFLEGVITFVSPCLLPMLPVYLSYFAGGAAEDGKRRALKGSLGFVAGFTLVFILLGAFAGTLGAALVRHQTLVNAVTGAVVVFFGLSFLGVFRMEIFQGGKAGGMRGEGFFASMLFGLVFAAAWTPCVGAFLGSALLLASQQGSALKGILMLLSYSAGLGVPFVLSALLLERLRGAIDFIRRHYRIINLVCGGFLIAIGALMMTGQMGRFLALLS